MSDSCELYTITTTYEIHVLSFQKNHDNNEIIIPSEILGKLIDDDYVHIKVNITSMQIFQKFKIHKSNKYEVNIHQMLSIVTAIYKVSILPDDTKNKNDVLNILEKMKERNKLIINAV